MDRNYERWHPDHITFRWVRGDSLEEGSQSYFEEEIGGELLKKTVEYASVEPNRFIELRPTSRLMRLVLPFITFSVEPEHGGCRFSQRIKIRTGPIGKWLNREQFTAVHQHLEEEGENLKRIMDADPALAG